jgi:hypothetical protein
MTGIPRLHAVAISGITLRTIPVLAEASVHNPDKDRPTGLRAETRARDKQHLARNVLTLLK